jgi:gentisate 1,2-dioxygenase
MSLDVEQAAPEQADPVGALYRQMADADLQALWTQAEDLMGAVPRPKTQAWVWRWQRLRELAQRAGELIPVERGGERRALALSNPGLGGRPYATNTLWAAIQYLGARESAPAHRHTAAAIRFVIEGEGAFTTVDGERCPMSRGDLVLTPNWAWHEHHNPTDGPMIWLDGLDLPLVAQLDAIFYENYPALYQADPGHGGGAERPSHPTVGQARYGHPGLLPVRPEAPRAYSPLMIYPWARTDAALAGLLAASDEASVSVRFANPADGTDALPTMRCAMLRLRGGRRTPSVASVGGQVIHVHDGSGESVIDGRRLPWGPGDIFVVPSWSVLDHFSAGPADLFVLSDQPVLERLALARESVSEQSQPIVGEFGSASSAG